ncbi:nonsense-mediated mRNA decay protein 1 [Pochonia chlamydosporia 170]|uniref:Nonsense-mediated mRNA decay protein 1 n=1 Tax=Pochonia chlamydosporia 170 TaxID=1380566 RepID=A0A179FXZ1_METCM|nr:nonsense-mediated mRNA decay protein 1 [Pochonia chlamydosporia 170]OAQ69913.1 nonsense-mediated mRNA decay protein 1 [Pochonia chlamydosporia 170]
MFNHLLIEDPRLRAAAERTVNCFDINQKLAFDALKAMNYGLLFIPGSPGSGKTHWALGVSALAQMGSDKVRVLFLQDVNKPVDEACHRMHLLYKTYGMEKSIIRLSSWPKESRRSLSVESLKPGSRNERFPDFHTGFFAQLLRRTASNAQEETHSKTAPTLDEAAWLHFVKNRNEFPIASAAFDQIRRDKRDIHHMPGIDLGACNDELRRLYEKVISSADFIATTPVAAAQESFASMFSPDIIFMDEAAHATELSALIPLALFKSKACIFLGECRTTRPCVRHQHQHSEQMKYPTLSRAMMHKDAAVPEWLTNHRSHNKLHTLHSALYYDGSVESNTGPQTGPISESSAEMVIYMNRLRGVPCDIPRLLKWFDFAATEQANHAQSPYSSAHSRYVIARVKELLEVDWFKSTSDDISPGSILIVTSAVESQRKYEKRLKSFEPEHRERVRVRTVGTTQGIEADVVFIDIARANEYINDTSLLNVALSRARQAEFILLEYPESSLYGACLKQIYDWCSANGQKAESDMEFEKHDEMTSSDLQLVENVGMNLKISGW